MINKEIITHVTHWSHNTFSFRTTRNYPNKFSNGEFTMIGLEQENKNIMRAYSIASANHESHLEFLSIKVKDGPLTSKLQNIKIGDEILINSKSTGTLVIDYLNPGRNLYLISTGTGLAPFMSIIKDPETYERFDKIILTHTVSNPAQLAYLEELTSFNKDWNLITKGKFIYFNTVTQFKWSNTGRITEWIKNGKLHPTLGCEPIDSDLDRAMICGSLGLNQDLMGYFKSIGMKEGNTSIPGEFVVEKAFVEK